MSRYVAMYVLVFALLVAFPTAIEASAQSLPNPTRIVVEFETEVPLLGQALTGTLVLDRNVDLETWAFDGQLAGLPAHASGSGISTSINDHTLRLTLETIDTWAMGALPKPALPATITMTSHGESAVLRWDRLGIETRVSITPTLILASTPSGHFTVTDLPQTGTGDTHDHVNSFTTIAALIFLALVCTNAGWWMARHVHHCDATVHPRRNQAP